MIQKGTRVVTVNPFGTGSVAYVRMASPSFTEIEAVSVLLDERRHDPSYSGTIFPAKNVGEGVRGVLFYNCGVQNQNCPPWAAEGVLVKGNIVPVLCDPKDRECPTCGYDDNAWDSCGPLSESWPEKDKLAPGKPWKKPS